MGREKRDLYSPQINDYISRIARRLPVELKLFTDDEAMLRAVKPDWDLILLDETGTLHKNSDDFAAFINRLLSTGSRDIVFAIGGAYGHIPSARTRSKLSISLSTLTLPHQIARLCLAEQLYRALTIINNEPYSH